jgi:hypothetical protein
MIKNTRTTIIQLLEKAGAREEGNPPNEEHPVQNAGKPEQKK